MLATPLSFVHILVYYNRDKEKKKHKKEGEEKNNNKNKKSSHAAEPFTFRPHVTQIKNCHVIGEHDGVRVYITIYKQSMCRQPE